MIKFLWNDCLYGALGEELPDSLVLPAFVKYLPKAVVQGRFSRDCNFFLAHRMFETDRTGVQANASVFI